MSGSSFNYAYNHVANFADELEDRLNSVTEPDTSTEPVRQRLLLLVREARRMAELMKQAEWLYSGDTGEATFMERVAEIEDRP